VGILLIALGAVFLVASSGGLGNSVFFIFPFVFVSTSDIVSTFAILAFVFIMLVFVMRSAVTYFSQVESMSDGELMKEYIPVGSTCDICSKPLPVDAVFCSSCGNPVDYDKASNQ